MEENIQKLIEYLQTVSPVIWRAMVNQVYVSAIQHCAWILFVITVIVILWKCVYPTRDNWEDPRVATSLTYLGTVAGIALIVGFALAAIGRFINPEYYAIQNLVGLVVGGK